LSTASLLFAEASIHEKVIICGVCRDVESKLPYTIQIIEEIGALFDDYQVVVYENDSQDNTRALLASWKEKNSKVVVISEDLTVSGLEKIIINRHDDNRFFRPEEIARARNIALDTAMSDRFSDYDYLIWLDMDFKLFPVIDGIIETFESKKEWDAVFAYGVDPANKYWDWYAFRDDSYPLGSELLGNEWWYMKKEFSLKPEDEWHLVYSAFGGCGIYRKSSITGCRYSGTVTVDLEQLNKKIIAQGKKTDHPQVMSYLDSLSALRGIVYIDKVKPNLPQIKHPKMGIILNRLEEPVIWKMSSFVFQYPSVCEHVPFHAKMILNGNDKLFINPRLVFFYGS